MLKITHKASIIILIIFCSSICLCQSKSDIIENIREEIESIHLDTTLKVVTLQNEEFLQNESDQGGELTGLYKRNRIIRIYKSIGKQQGVFISEYYYDHYKKSKLIFIREKFNSYVYDDSSKTFDYTKLNTTYTGKYYFYKGKLLDSTVTGIRFSPEQSIDLEDILIKESNDSYSVIANKIKSIRGIK